jgi:hypothetical protein
MQRNHAGWHGERTALLHWPALVRRIRPWQNLCPVAAAAPLDSFV